jgi:hypothetical protein
MFWKLFSINGEEWKLPPTDTEHSLITFFPLLAFIVLFGFFPFYNLPLPIA